jgi:CDP-ribitol ribitolphosphotransferase
LGNYLNQRGFYYDYSQMTPGPIFFKTQGMIDYLLHLDTRFDRQAIRDFRERFMRSCDGHATERILERVFGRIDERPSDETGSPTDEGC